MSWSVKITDESLAEYRKQRSLVFLFLLFTFPYFQTRGDMLHCLKVAILQNVFKFAGLAHLRFAARDFG